MCITYFDWNAGGEWREPIFRSTSRYGRKMPEDRRRSRSFSHFRPPALIAHSLLPSFLPSFLLSHGWRFVKWSHVISDDAGEESKEKSAIVTAITCAATVRWEDAGDLQPTSGAVTGVVRWKKKITQPPVHRVHQDLKNRKKRRGNASRRKCTREKTPQLHCTVG